MRLGGLPRQPLSERQALLWQEQVLRRYIDGIDVSKNCNDCTYVHKFDPRSDEIERGHTLGCKKYGWEGYTKAETPACEGAFFVPSSTLSKPGS